uniref:Uncharacterized protein n=1 Tax=Oryza glaberrima TaxID=4538 RepID=I1NW96_ORYGL
VPTLYMVHTASLLMRATWICQSPCTKLLKAAGHVYIIVVVIVNCESLSLYISPLMTMFELPCLTTPATQFAFGSVIIGNCKVACSLITDSANDLSHFFCTMYAIIIVITE